MRQTIYQDISHLAEAIAGSRKILLVVDGSFPFLNIREDIEAMPVPHAVFDQFTPNPLYEDVCKGVELFNAEQCDTILAVGGGSAMDVAKCVKLYCRMQKDRLYLEQEYGDTGVRLIAIPTTAGTGSESTRYAVIYYDGKKQSVTHDSIIPDIAILEPKVLKTLPLYQKKCTMLDALCQGIESWWSVNSTNESKQYSKIAVETIVKYWQDYILTNTDEAAEKIMLAANYAGRAICITQTTAPHAFSYKLTSMYGLPHGHAVAICLPAIWQYMVEHMDKCTDARGKHELATTFKQISDGMGTPDVESAIKAFSMLLNAMDIQRPIAGHQEKEVEILANSVNPIRLKNNPVELDETAIRSLYDTILSD